MKSPDMTDSSELMRLWTLDDGTRCVVAVAGSLLELRLVCDGAICKRAILLGAEGLWETSWLWRLECEIDALVAHSPAQPPN